MAKVRGYSSYHGRGPAWKTAAAVLLIAVILASFGILFLERYIVEDSSGLRHIQFPWALETEEASGSPDGAGTQGESPDESGDESGENAGESTENPEDVQPAAPVRELLRTYGSYATPATWDTYNDEFPIAERYGYTAFELLLKNTDGTVFFDAPSAIPGCRRINASTTEVLRTLNDSQFHTVARMACFLDNYASNSNVQRYGLRNTGRYIFFDGNDQNWMDPSKPDAREYLCNLARDAAELGFDEILLTDVGYPTEGKLNKIAYGDTPIEENLSAFLSEMKTALEPYPVKLSVEMPRAVFTHAENPSGLTLDIAAPYVDRMYCVVTEEEIAYCDGTVSALRDGTIEFVPILRTLPKVLPRQFLYIPEQ